MALMSDDVGCVESDCFEDGFSCTPQAESKSERSRKAATEAYREIFFIFFLMENYLPLPAIPCTENKVHGMANMLLTNYVRDTY